MWRLVTPSSTRAAARRARFVAPGGIGPIARHWRIAASCPSPSPTPPRLSPTSDRRSSGRRASRGHGSKPVYQFSVELPGGALQVVRDFSRSNSFTWNPMQEGTYEIRVDVKTGFGARKSESTSATYTAQTRVVGNSAVVSPMANPLVALYSAPPSPGASMYVQFAKQGPTLSWQNTSPLPIVPGESTNFIVAGMLPNTTYLMRHVLDDGTVSAPLAFTTGSLPANLQFPHLHRGAAAGRRDRPEPERDLPRRAHRPAPAIPSTRGDRPERQRHLVL